MGRIARRSLPALLTATVLFALAAVLVACSGGAPSPGSPPSVEAPRYTRTQVIKALEDYGVTITNPTDFRVTRGADSAHVTATGGGMQIGSKTSTATGTVASVGLELVGKTWRVLNLTGNY